MTRLFFATLLALSTTNAMACDDVCKDNEIYSDEAEMCVEKTVQS